MHIELKNSNLNKVWKNYNQTRVTGDKKTANKLLFEFIELLKKQDQTEITSFVDDICSLTLDSENKIILNNGIEVSEKEIRIQHPLFKQIIVPILADQYKKGSAKHIRWIGQFEQFFYSDFEMTKAFLENIQITEYFETIYFLEKSFSIEKNQNTLNLLLNRIAQNIYNFTHEVPAGVLVYPEVFEKVLVTFRKYLEQSATREIWKNVITEWELIAKHWKIYSENSDQYLNFENYLKTNQIEIN